MPSTRILTAVEELASEAVCVRMGVSELAEAVSKEYQERSSSAVGVTAGAHRTGASKTGFIIQVAHRSTFPKELDTSGAVSMSSLLEACLDSIL